MKQKKKPINKSGIIILLAIFCFSLLFSQLTMAEEILPVEEEVIVSEELSDDAQAVEDLSQEPSAEIPESPTENLDPPAENLDPSADTLEPSQDDQELPDTVLMPEEGQEQNTIDEKDGPEVVTEKETDPDLLSPEEPVTEQESITEEADVKNIQPEPVEKQVPIEEPVSESKKLDEQSAEPEKVEEELKDDESEELSLQMESDTLSPGMTGDAVLKLQNALKNLNYLWVTPDGIFGAKTLLALQRFQLFHGLSVTGVADETTLSLLYGGNAVSYESLRKGSRGTAVYYIQKYLYDLGYLPVEPDGIYGGYTDAAAKAYQAQAGLEYPDGCVGNWTTLQMINENLPFVTLQKGSRGNAVRILQKQLQNLGFLNVTPDGIFGGYTERAVEKFQLYAGLEITGVADAATVNAIYRGTVSFSALSKGSRGTAVLKLQRILKDMGYLTVEPDGIYGNYTTQAVKNFQILNGITRDGAFGKRTAEVLFSDPVLFDPEALDNSVSEVQALARAVLDQVGWDLYAAFKWSVGMNYNINLDLGYNNTQTAIYSFNTYYGNCVSMASTFYWMAKELGFEAYVIEGSVPYRSGGYGEHAWVEIVYNGATYVCDPDFEMQVGRNGYFISYGQSGTWKYVYGYILQD